MGVLFSALPTTQTAYHHASQVLTALRIAVPTSETLYPVRPTTAIHGTAIPYSGYGSRPVA